MDIVFLLQAGLGLISTLAILIFLLIYPTKKRKQKKAKIASKTTNKSQAFTPLKDLVAIIKDKNTDSKTLKSTLEDILKYYGKIPKKLGTRINPEFAIYEDILYTICRHPNTSADIIVNFNSKLEKLNEEYKPQINNAITKGLNSRVIR